jgi:DNA-binding NarL/FixJ family response regulator
MPLKDRTAGLTAIVFDRYPLFLEVLIRLLRARHIEVCGGTTSSQQALELLDEHLPDLFVAGLDGGVAGKDRVALVRQATDRSPALKVIVLSNMRGDDATIDEVFAAGASAYVTNRASAEDIAVAIRQMFEHSVHFAAEQRRREFAVVAGEAGLTDREIEVLGHVAQGYSNAELARLLSVTPQTVKFHLSNIYRKLNVSNRTQATRWAQLANLGAEPEAPSLAQAR